MTPSRGGYLGKGYKTCASLSGAREKAVEQQEGASDMPSARNTTVETVPRNLANSRGKSNGRGGDCAGRYLWRNGRRYRKHIIVSGALAKLAM